MDTHTDTLILAAAEARSKAYVRYSGHPVGSAILADNGKVYVGCNVENAAYPLSLCAEPAAISAMILDGGKRIKHVVVSGPGAHLCTPCGGCRQRISEFADADTRLTVVDVKNTVLLDIPFWDLLPHAFNEDNLIEAGK